MLETTILESRRESHPIVPFLLLADHHFQQKVLIKKRRIRKSRTDEQKSMENYEN